MKIALCMIVGCKEGEDQSLRRALSTVAPFVDDIYITLTGKDIKACEAVAKDYHANISHHRPIFKADKKIISWLTSFFSYKPHMKLEDEMFLFDDARNFNFSQVPKDYDWIFWMDADDVLQGGENLKELGRVGLEKGVEAFYFDYIYQAELDEENRVKHVIIKHLRERLVRNTGVYKWIAPIHETLIEQRPTVKTDNYDIRVVHLSTEEQREASLTRNLNNLELAIYRTQGKDPRHTYYLAKAYFDIQTTEYDKNAEKLILNHYVGGEHQSGWPQERSQAWEYLGEIARRQGNHARSIKAFANALIEDPEPQSIYVNIAVSYMLKGEWERALFWIRLADKVPNKKTTLVTNPKDIKARTLEVIYNCALNLNKIDEAWAAAVKLVELFPNAQNVKDSYQFITQLRTERDMTRSIAQHAKFLQDIGEVGKIKPLLASIPKPFEDNPFFINLYQQNNPPRVWGKREIAIYCGAGFTIWGPKQMKDPQGSFMGGSEIAVVRATQELSKQGWKVTVYNDCGTDEGEHDGVTYLPYYKFNRLDNFNILIAWRDIRFFDGEFKAKKTYLWSHDIQQPIEYTKERLAKITKVMFLSKWHRDNVPHIPEEKVFLSSNGFD